MEVGNDQGSAARLKIGLEIILEGEAFAGSLVAWLHTNPVILAGNTLPEFRSGSQDMMKNFGNLLPENACRGKKRQSVDLFDKAII